MDGSGEPPGGAPTSSVAGMVDPLTSLWNEAAPGEPLEAQVIREKLLEDPDHDPGLWVGAWHGGTLAGAAVGVIRRPPFQVSPLGFVQLLAVRPAYRRRRVATRLLDELERRMWARGAKRIRAFGSSPTYLWPGVDVHCTPALCLFSTRGYRVLGYEFNMRVDLTRPVATPAPACRRERLAGLGITVKRFHRDDGDALRDWLGRTWGPQWAYEGLMALRRRPEPSGFAAWQDGRVVGFAVYDSTRPGWFGPMGVEPKLQGSGLGVELCVRALEDMAARRYLAAEIAWAGPLCFYARKVGATVSRTFAQMERERIDA